MSVTNYITMSDGERIALHSWIPETEPRAVLQLSHGMVEYAKRYDHFGRFLNMHGIAMYAHDHRGHGETAGNEENLGFLAEKSGFQRVIEDLHEVIDHVKKQYPRLPLVLLGHSFGSFISQGYIEQYKGEIDACILSGTAGPRLLLVSVAKYTAAVIKKLKGTAYRSETMNNLAFGNYTRHIPDARSKNAWLTRDEKIVEEYDSDPYTTFIPTIGFFYDLFDGLNQIHRKKAIRSISPELPILLIAGDADPVGDYGKTVTALYKVYKTIGIKDVSLKLYSGGRHEMLNEINRQEVMEDLLEWIDLHLPDANRPSL